MAAKAPPIAAANARMKAAASLGIPEKNTIEMLPATIGSEKIRWVVLDDASDTTRAVTNTRKFISEEKVDVILGSTVTPNSLAMVDIAAEAETPMISMAASARIVDPVEDPDIPVAQRLQQAVEPHPRLRRARLLRVGRTDRRHAVGARNA
jgi:hypothetical protein